MSMGAMGQPPLLSSFLGVLLILSSFPFFTSAGDPSMLQDLCVADLDSEVRMNGFACKKTEEVTEMDFWSDVIANPRDASNKMGSSVTTANVMKVPGLNTLGVSMARIDYAPNGVNPPHFHPRATEMAFVLEGEILMAFVTTEGRRIWKVVKKGEVFVFPKGLVHYQWNLGKKPAVAIAAFDSQNAGVQSIPRTLFASKPQIEDVVLAKSFHLRKSEVRKIKSRFA